MQTAGTLFVISDIKSLNHPVTCESCETQGRPYQTLDDFPGLRSRILMQLQAAESESRYYAGILDGAVIRYDGGDTTTYTIFWQNVGSTIYKLIVRANPVGDLVEMGVLRIAPDPAFMTEYFQNNATLKDFVGDIGVVTVNDFLDAKRSGHIKSLGRNKSVIDDCQTLIFVNGGPVGGNGGGDGNTGNPGSGPIVRSPWSIPFEVTINGVPIGSGGGCNTIRVECGCNQNPPHIGGYGIYPGCTCKRPDVISIVPCNTDNNLRGHTTPPGLELQAQRDKGAPYRAKNLWWDCVDLLNGAGLLTDHDLYLLRLRECDRYMAGFEGDVNDGATTGHPDAAFCSVWKPYYDRCLSPLPADETQSRWAALMWRNGAAFDYFVENDGMCRVNRILAQLLNSSDATINLFVEILKSPNFTHEEKNVLIEEGRVGEFLQLIEMGIESGLSNADIEYVVKRWIDNGGNYVEILPINYSTATNQERVEHIHKWLRFIQWFQRCNPTFCCPYYALRPVTSQDPPGPTVASYFFNNFTQGGLGTTLEGSIRCRLPSNTLVPIKIELTHWGQPRFQISPIGPIHVSSAEDNSKFAYPKYQSSGQAAAIISLYFPTSQEPNFVKDFIDRPCR